MGTEKRMFTITELVDMGFPEQELRDATRIEGQTFATRRSPKRGSKWIFDLQEYKNFRIERQRIHQRNIRYVGDC